MPSFRTPGRHGYSVQFSPYFSQRLACSSCQHYGIAGGGTLFVLDVLQDGIHLIQSFEYNNGLFDVAWAEDNENILLTAGGDGSIQIWDVAQPQGPLKILKEHTKEINTISWSPIRTDNLVLSASWDTLVKVWDVSRNHSLGTHTGHHNIVYEAVWSPQIPGVFASASGDRTLRVWDLKVGHDCTLVIDAHNEEILTCDWCKYDKNQLFSGSVDGTIRGWDLRRAQVPFCELRGHEYAVRKIRTSPYVATSLASASYDFTVRTWDISQQMMLEVIEQHTEFVYGLDFNIHIPGQFEALTSTAISICYLIWNCSSEHFTGIVMEENSKYCVPENRGNSGKDESAHREAKKEIQERKQNGVKTTGVLMRKELISAKAQNQIHNRPTLPHILTAYGLQDEVAIKKKEKKEIKRSKRRKKKETFYEDDTEKDRERDLQKEERHLQIVRDMERLRDYYYDEYARLLENKVNKQKQEIRERSDAFLNKITEVQETERRESHRVKRRLGRHTLISDISFLNNIPKTDVFHIVQLQDKMAKEGKLRTQSDYDEFWQQMQNPKVFNTYFKMPKNTIDSSSYNENAPIDNRQNFPSDTSFHIHTAVSGTTAPPSWVASIPKSSSNQMQQATSTARMRCKSFISDLEKRFPKLEMPTLHCFTMDLGPRPPDPKEISFERHLHKMEKQRKDYTQKLTKMHQYAMIHNAATSRILEKHQDLDLEGSKLTDLISDYYFYLGQRHSPTESKESLSSVLKAAPNLDVLSLESPASASDSLAQFDACALGVKQDKPTSSKQTAICKAVPTDSQAISIDEKPQTETLPLALVDLATHDRIMEAKCLSTLWINYAKNQTAET